MVTKETMNGSVQYEDVNDHRSYIHNLKGLGHAILGNFSIDQMVIELTEITK